MFFCHEEGNAKNREEISPSTRELTLPLCPNHPKNQNPFSSFKPMNKETELAYLNTILGSANDILTVLKHMESQFQSMEERSAGTTGKWYLIIDMVTVFENWSTVFSLASKSTSDDVSVITIPEKKEMKK